MKTASEAMPVYSVFVDAESARFVRSRSAAAYRANEFPLFLVVWCQVVPNPSPDFIQFIHDNFPPFWYNAGEGLSLRPR
jgi:hypothetical protein